MVFELQETKDRANLEKNKRWGRGAHLTGRGTLDFLIRNYTSKKGVEGNIQVLKENKRQPRMLYLAKLSFKSEEIKSFLKQTKNWRKVWSVDLALQEMLKEVLQREGK